MNDKELNRLIAIVNHRYFYSKQRDALCYREDLKLFNEHVPVSALTNSSGYKRVTIDGKTRYLHRITFLFIHGFLPEMVDHIDGDRANNSIGNLRAATAKENSYNKGNIKGVRVRNDRYQAYINKDNKQICLGTFGSEEEAIAARKAAEKIYFKNFRRTVESSNNTGSFNYSNVVNLRQPKLQSIMDVIRAEWGEQDESF